MSRSRHIQELESYGLLSVSKCPWAAMFGICGYCSNPANSSGTPTPDWSMKGNKEVHISRFQEMVHHSAGMCYVRALRKIWQVGWLVFFSLPKCFCGSHPSDNSELSPSGVCSTDSVLPPHLDSGCLLFLWFEQQLLRSISWGPEHVSNESGCWVTSCWQLSDRGSVRAHARVCAHILITHGAQERVPSYLSMRKSL